MAGINGTMTAAISPIAQARRSLQPAYWALLVAAFALAQQIWSSIDCDVSWLITIAERVLDGATLYRDIEEVNPPASVLIYMPIVALARWLVLRVEPVTVVVVAVLAGFSIVQTGRIFDRPLSNRGLLPAAAAFVLLVLPADLFAQREHIALIVGLPMLALLAARIEGRSVGRLDPWAAGIGAGIMVVIKPHLVLALVPIVSWAIMRQRSIGRTLGPEWAAFALVCVAYAAVVWLAFPLYLERMLPLLRLVYLPGRDSWTHLLSGTMVLVPAVLAMLTLWLARGHITVPTATALLATAGFVVAGLAQGKGYPNHGYPAVATGFLAVALELSRTGKARRLGALSGAVLALVSTIGYAYLPEPHALRDAVLRVGPAHPKLIGISFDFGLGHPLTRWVDGRWAGRRGSLWVSGNVRQLLEDRSLLSTQRAAFERAETEDAAMLAADIVRERPDIVLVDAEPGTAWIAAHSVVKNAMKPYRPTTKVGTVTLWARH